MSHSSNTSPKRFLHPAGAPVAPPRLYGQRIMMRPLVAHDFEAWSEVRLRNVDWLTIWEPRRSDFLADPATDRDAFERRCVARDRERQNGSAYTLGLFVNNLLVGEVNINNVVRGAMQTGTIGYWI
ncbi:MAG: GNAT family N-acetyltransferase, partial [Ilumatobacteraceae bacterium]